MDEFGDETGGYDIGGAILMSEDHDILVGIHGDVRHIRERLDDLKRSDDAQWKKIDALSEDSVKAKNSIGFLTTGFWTITAGLIGGGGLMGIAIWLMSRN